MGTGSGSENGHVAMASFASLIRAAPVESDANHKKARLTTAQIDLFAILLSLNIR